MSENSVATDAQEGIGAFLEREPLLVAAPNRSENRETEVLAAADMRPS